MYIVKKMICALSVLSFVQAEDIHVQLLEKSAYYIDFFVKVNVELERLKSKTNEIMTYAVKNLKELDIDNESEKTLQDVLKRLENLNKRLMTCVKDKIDLDDGLIEEKSSNKSEQILVKLEKAYVGVITMIAQCNILRENCEKYIEDTSHDVRNLNTSKQRKINEYKKLQKEMKDLSGQLKKLVAANKEIIEDAKALKSGNSKKSNKSKK